MKKNVKKIKNILIKTLLLLKMENHSKKMKMNLVIII